MSFDDSFGSSDQAVGLMEPDCCRPHSVLDAIKQGIWDYEPELCAREEFVATQALPGTLEKLSVLAKRLQQGLPLWHPDDRKTYDPSAAE